MDLPTNHLIAPQRGLKAVGHFLLSYHIPRSGASWDGNHNWVFHAASRSRAGLQHLRSFYHSMITWIPPTYPIAETPSHASPRCGVDAESSCRGKNLTVTFLPQAAPVFWHTNTTWARQTTNIPREAVKECNARKTTFFMQAAPTPHKQIACFTHTCLH